MAKNEESEFPGNANLPIGGASAAKQRHDRATREKSVLDAVWRSRGYLPHFESPVAIQHVTFHLADSLPQAALTKLASEVKRFPDEERDSEYRKRLDAWIDAGYGSCVLREPAVAGATQRTLLFFDVRRYRMYAWAVMPNHVHALLEPLGGWTIAKIVASWKKFTGRMIRDWRRERDGESGGPVWHREYWDRYIRDEKHFNRTVEYIHQNPVKARLVGEPKEWSWSSAGFGRVDLPE